MHPDGRSDYWVVPGDTLGTTTADGPIHGPAFRWEEEYRSTPDDKWATEDVAVEVLTIYACEYFYGTFTKFRDDNYWRSAYEWGGPGTKAYVRLFDSTWCWIRSDGVLLEQSPAHRWHEKAGDMAVREGLKLLLDASRDAEPIDPRGTG